MPDRSRSGTLRDGMVIFPGRGAGDIVRRAFAASTRPSLIDWSEDRDRSRPLRDPYVDIENGVARIRRVDGGIFVEPGATVDLASGDTHVMLLDLKEPIVKGSSFDGTPVFERARTVPVRFSVERFGAADAGPSHELHQP